MINCDPSTTPCDPLTTPKCDPGVEKTGNEWRDRDTFVQQPGSPIFIRLNVSNVVISTITDCSRCWRKSTCFRGGLRFLRGELCLLRGGLCFLGSGLCFLRGELFFLRGGLCLLGSGLCATVMLCRIRLFFLLLVVTLVTGPRRPLSLKLSDTRVYEPQMGARLGTSAQVNRPRAMGV